MVFPSSCPGEKIFPFLPGGARLVEGISCADHIIFPSNWQGGGDYSIRFAIQNVSDSLFRLHYFLPRCENFWLSFPEPLDVAPGLVKFIEIKFRPVRSDLDYQDALNFRLERSGDRGVFDFSIPLMAPLPKFRAGLDRQSLEFGRIAVGEWSEENVFLINDGELPCDYSWRVPEPWFLSENFPSSGFLKAGERLKIPLKILPTLAERIQGKAICFLAGSAHSLALGATGEFPRFELCCSEDDRPLSLVDFGSSLVGHKEDRKLFLYNRAKVRCSFAIKQLRAIDCSSSLPAVFSFKPGKGALGPGERVALKVQFAPLVAGTLSCERYAIRSPGGNIIEFQCSGLAVGPRVVSDRLAIEFSDVRVGEGAAVPVKLFNQSAKTAEFQILWPENSSFSFEPSQGKIPAQMSITVTARFRPRQPINYSSPLFVLVRNSQPIRLHVLGSAFNEIVRPARLCFYHVQRAELRSRAGERWKIPQILRKELQQGSAREFSPQEIDELWQRQEFESGAESAAERLFSLQAGTFHKSPPDFVEGLLDENFLDFSSFSSHSLVVRNFTQARMVATWDFHKNPANENSQPSAALPFLFEPLSADLPPNSSFEFKVSFVPSVAAPSRYFHHEAHCFLAYKSQRSFRLVDDFSFTPPLKLAVGLFAHSLPAGTPHFISNSRLLIPQHKMIEESSDRLAILPMPPTSFHALSQSFASFLVENPDDTPAHFCLEEFSSPLAAPGEFRIFPVAGLVAPKKFQLFQVQFAPNSAELKNFDAPLRFAAHRFRFCLNFGESFRLLESAGFSYRSALEFSFGRQLFFKPTALGLSSVAEFSLVNRARIPCVFQFQLSAADRAILTVEPEQGALAGNARISISARFRPNEAKTFAVKIPVKFREFSLLEQRALADLSAFQRLERRRDLILASAPAAPSVGGFSLDFSPDSFSAGLSGGVLDFRFRGVSSVGTLESSTKIVDFGLLELERSSRHLVEVENPSEAPIKFRARFTENEKSKIPLSHAGLQLSSWEGSVEGRSSMPLWLSFQPRRVGILSAQLEIELIQEEPLISPSPPLVVSLTGRCSLPAISFTSARLEFSDSAKFSVSELLEHAESALEHRDLISALQLPAINEALRRAASEPLTQRKHFSPQSSELSAELARAGLQFSFRFPAAPAATGEPRVALLSLEVQNPGQLACRWAFHFPDELLNVQPEKWFEEGDPNRFERLEAAIGDAKLFQIEPRRGRLEPGERQTVLISYSYQCVGVHRFPCVLSLADGGAQISIKLHGETLSDNNEKPRVEIPQLWRALNTIEPEILTMENSGAGAAPSQMLERLDEALTNLASASPALLDLFEVAVLEFPDSTVPPPADPPIRSFTLYNPHSRALEFSADLTAVDRFNEKHGGLEIFRCLNATGKILPGKSVKLQCQFAPVSFGRSHAQLPIRLSFVDGTGAVEIPAVLVGRGVQTNRQAPAKSPALEFSPPSSLEIPGGLVLLSSEAVDFGVLGFGASALRHFRLANAHPSLTVKFQFQQRSSAATRWRELQAGNVEEALILAALLPASPPSDPLLSVFPSCGLLPPGCSVSVFVHLTGSFSCLIVEEEILCLAEVAEAPENFQAGDEQEKFEQPKILASAQKSAKSGHFENSLSAELNSLSVSGGSSLRSFRPVNSSLFRPGPLVDSSSATFESSDRKPLVEKTKTRQSAALLEARRLPVFSSSLGERTFGAAELPGATASGLQNSLNALNEKLEAAVDGNFNALHWVLGEFSARRAQGRAIQLSAQIAHNIGNSKTRQQADKENLRTETNMGKVAAVQNLLAETLNHYREAAASPAISCDSRIPFYQHIKNSSSPLSSSAFPLCFSCCSSVLFSDFPSGPFFSRFLTAAVLQATRKILDQTEEKKQRDEGKGKGNSFIDE